MTLSEMIFTMKNNNQDTDRILYTCNCLFMWIVLAYTAIINLRGNFKKMAEEGQC